VYIIEFDGFRIFHGSDSGFVEDLKNIESRVHVALVPAGDPSPTASPQVALEMTKATNPYVVIPMHGNPQQMEEFSNLVIGSELETTVTIPSQLEIIIPSQVPSPEDCGPYQIFQNGQCVDIGFITITVSTDKSSYSDGETIIVSGKVSDILENFAVSLSVVSPQGLRVAVAQPHVSYSGSYSTELTAGGQLMQDEGFYTIKVLYARGDISAETSFYFSGTTVTGGTTLDNIPPKILQPKDIVVDAADSNGSFVTYEVLAIDNEDEIVKPSCSPYSGSLFSIGDTKVVCSAFDSSGNPASQKSFLVTVNAPSLLIPNWIKEVAAFWCDDKIDDASFIEGIQYLIDNGIIIVQATTSGSSITQEIPSWVKNNACWWSQGLIADGDFASGLKYLIEVGVIKI